MPSKAGVVLRSFQPQDTRLLVAYLNDDVVTRYITSAIPSPYTQTDALWWVEHSQGYLLFKR